MHNFILYFYILSLYVFCALTVIVVLLWSFINIYFKHLVIELFWKARCGFLFNSVVLFFSFIAERINNAYVFDELMTL